MSDVRNYKGPPSWKEFLGRQAKQDALANRPPMIKPAGKSFECDGVDVVANGALTHEDCKEYVDTYVAYRLFGDLRPVLPTHGSAGGSCAETEPLRTRKKNGAKQGYCPACRWWLTLVQVKK